MEAVLWIFTYTMIILLFLLFWLIITSTSPLFILWIKFDVWSIIKQKFKIIIVALREIILVISQLSVNIFSIYKKHNH